ncbi:uncharacterized protein [Amphiura filiformis]|uniref:uncharacterized protein n=1 Tax=Amphiura filiformis TaxID=82378 RepID=UPI003B21FFEC
MSSLKNGCGSFIMKQIGAGDELGPIMKCIPYVNEYFPHYLTFCYDGITRNFADIEHYQITCLSLENLEVILSGQNGSITAPDEFFVYRMVQRWIMDTYDEAMVLERESAASHLLPLIRFYNMDATQIAEVKESPLGKLCSDTIMKNHLAHAYEMQAEMFAFSVKSPKRRKLSGGRVEHKCSCNPSGGRCEHMNPRIYFADPYGKSIKTKLDSNVNHISSPVVDLRSLESYIKIFGKNHCEKHGDKLSRWKISWVTKGDDNSSCDHFQLIPPGFIHVGRTFDVCIHVSVHSRDARKNRFRVDTHCLNMVKYYLLQQLGWFHHLG